MENKSIKRIEELLFKEKQELSDSEWDMLKKDKRAGIQKLVKRKEQKREQQRKLVLLFEQMSRYERRAFEEGIKCIAGVDEVGRGPLAGPVVAAAVILSPEQPVYGLQDSKKLTKKKLEQLYAEIMEKALDVSVGVSTPEEIDRLNIYQASKKAMEKAVLGLKKEPEYLLIDAMELPLEFPQESIIKGDAKSISIAAASIIAKVTRDRMMEELGRKYPQFGFERHVGYPTKEHIEAIKKFGVVEEHRQSFSPIKDMV
ncbi:ribonuclease HII [Pseudalkalibacillus caeni]|uniref:Ribonuclease HII n=1 Tax=Exobacillus caeni TaxID=2574798 RepID=A0A5R9F6U7_9BACL|nr:ribonuclease HII [Pseudalkalibacillus caeni]TLS37348.1 ribonuclease HII [Pseudalkalibacillus caeni]